MKSEDDLRHPVGRFAREKSIDTEAFDAPRLLILDFNPERAKPPERNTPVTCVYHWQCQ